MNKERKITMITEDYCSFEVAKLLKEKGFNSDECEVHYDPYNHNEYEITHQMARRWLREKHHIYAGPVRQGNYNDCSDNYSWIVAKDGVIYRNPFVSEKLSYEDAVEAALKYCLTNLIK